jgi:hypothetical protein
MCRKSIISNRGIEKISIRGNGLIEARNVGNRKLESEVMRHGVAGFSTIPLWGILQCIPYMVNIHASKIGRQGLNIRILGKDRFRTPVHYCRVWREVVLWLKDAMQINVREAQIHIFLEIQGIDSFLVFLIQESRYFNGII